MEVLGGSSDARSKDCRSDVTVSDTRSCCGAQCATVPSKGSAAAWFPGQYFSFPPSNSKLLNCWASASRTAAGFPNFYKTAYVFNWINTDSEPSFPQHFVLSPTQWMYAISLCLRGPGLLNRTAAWCPCLSAVKSHSFLGIPKIPGINCKRKLHMNWKQRETTEENEFGIFVLGSVNCAIMMQNILKL